MPFDHQKHRLRIFAWLAVAGFLLLLARLVFLQILHGKEYKKTAEENRIRTITTLAPRGNIYDRNGALLVGNKPSFAVTIIPADFTNPQAEIPLLSRLTGIPADTLADSFAAAKTRPLTPLRLKRDIDAATIARIEEHKRYLPGVVVEAIPLREYVYKEMAAHLFGYMGAIDEEEYARLKDQGYSPGDFLGKSGLEKVWEPVLRGRDGGREIEVNAAGEEVRLIGDRTAIPGQGIVLTLDGNLQQAVERILTSHLVTAPHMGHPAARAAAVVVMDPRNGAIRAMASRPAFDPSWFAGGISIKDWDRLRLNSLTPLTNRAMQNAYPPGSVFKIVTAVAALEEGLVTPGEIFEDRGVYVFYGWKYYGWKREGLGKLNIVDAMAWSSDPVFYELGCRLGVDLLAHYAALFGLGQPTGIALPGEAAGFVPTREWKESTYGEPWFPGETVIAAIGQGYYLTTPLQLANLVSAVANGGILYRPYVVDKILTRDGRVEKVFSPEQLKIIPLSPETWNTLCQGLRAVVERGTAQAAFAGFPVPVAGKTGTSETGTGTTHAWFACYAPVENPVVTVVVFVENGGEGGGVAAPLARRILDAYFGRPPAPESQVTPPPGTTE